MRALGLLVVALVAAAGGCAPVVVAGPYFASPLERVGGATAPVFRTLAPPARCDAVEGPVVLLPALGFGDASWADVASRLGACRARVLVDLPGVGESAPLDRPLDGDALLAHLVALAGHVASGRPVVLVGHSLGGAIAARLAARLGDRVAALVLVDAPTAPFALTRWERLVLHGDVWPPLLRLVGPSLGVRIALPRLAGVGRRFDDLAVGLLARELSDSRRRAALYGYYRSFLDAAALSATQGALPVVRAPTLIVWGDHDDVVPLAVADATARALGGEVERVVLARVGHLAPLEVSGELAARIDGFLAKLAPAPPPAAGPGHAAAATSHAAPATSHAAAPLLLATPRSPGPVTRATGAITPGRRIYGSEREWFPVAGVGALVDGAGRLDGSFVAGVARGSIDDHWPLEAGRLVLTAGAAVRLDGDDHRLAWLRATARLELVWRYAGGFHVDGTLAFDPRTAGLGGYVALGYVPSLVPWLRLFVARGALPGDAARFLFGVELDVRAGGLLY